MTALGLIFLGTWLVAGRKALGRLIANNQLNFGLLPSNWSRAERSTRIMAAFGGTMLILIGFLLLLGFFPVAPKPN